jgi:nucleotide-binding universal stress UspA family protein
VVSFSAILDTFVKKPKNAIFQISGLINSIGYNAKRSKFRFFTNESSFVIYGSNGLSVRCWRARDLFALLVFLVVVNQDEGGLQHLGPSEILIFNVVEPFPYQVPESFLSEKKFIAKFTELGRKIISDYKKKYRRDTIKIKTAIAIGKPYVAICEKAEKENFDLVIIGSRGLSPGVGYLLGSVSEKVLKLCPCPVMIVK